MARAKKTAVEQDLNPRRVRFNVKATPVVREARTALLNAIVACKGREADLDGMVDTLEVVTAFLEARGKRDKDVRKQRAATAVKTAKAKQAALDNQRLITAQHEVAQAGRGLNAAKAKLADIKARQGE